MVQSNYPTDLCLHRLFELQVQRRPQKTAVIFENEKLTYLELDYRANQLAHYLRSQGVKPESIVGLIMERSLEMPIEILGIIKAGGSVLPIDPEFPQERINFMLKDSNASLILTRKSFLGRLNRHNTNVICIDTDWEFISQESQSFPISEVTDENLCIVVYTSGSTGKPKGVMLSHRAYCSRILWAQSVYQLTETDRFLVKAFKIFWPLWAGGTAIIPKPAKYQDINYLVQLIIEQKITICFVTPSMLKVLLELPDISNCDSLKHIFCSGESLSLELQNRFFALLNAELHNLYGPTEASYATFWDCKREHQQIVPIGRPTDMDVYILNSELKPVSIKEKGELYIGGIGLARGYLNNPHLTAERFIQNIFSDNPEARLFKTGDLARYLPDSNIDLLGRIDRQVKIRGFRVELWEIESTLAQHPAVREVVVIACEDVLETKYLVAYIVLHPEKDPTISELRKFLADKLPDYMMPTKFVVLDALPLTPNGKVDLCVLPEPEQLRPNLESAFVAPSTSVEQQIADIWTQLLKLDTVGIHDNFFDLGGHSLLATQVISRLRQTFAIELPLQTLFQTPTVAQLSDYIETIHWASQPSPTPASDSTGDYEEGRL
jgi:amino acid adenylation domain-containing protein